MAIKQFHCFEKEMKVIFRVTCENVSIVLSWI